MSKKRFMADGKFLVKFQITEQVSEDEWSRVWKEKLFDQHTTLFEIEEWVKSKFRHESERIMVEVSLSKPEL